jgi:tetratricopeptide (TPR) repeat protein
MKIHPHDLLLQDLFSTVTDEHPEVLDHVIECTDCQGRAKALLRSKPSPLAAKVELLVRRSANSGDYGGALDKSMRNLDDLQAFYERERIEAPSLIAELMNYPAKKREFILRNHSRFQTWGLFEQLLNRSREQNYQDAALGEKLALLALEIPDRLDPSFFSEERIEDLRARAWGCIANARRVRSDLRGSEDAFAIAFSHLARGTGEPMEKAELLDLKASLRRAQRRFDEALRLLRRSIIVFRQLGERQQAGRVLVSMSTVHRYASEPERAIPLLYQALELIDASREPRLLLVAWHNLIDDLAETGRFTEAQSLLVKAHPLYQQFPNSWAHYPRKWVEGRIARGLGQNEQAEALFSEARDGFLAEGVPYDTALVSLELACLYAEQGRVTELRRLSEEMMPIFSSRQIHREALAALAFWKQAVEAEKAGLDLVTEVAAYLKRARHDPALRFQRLE